MIVKLNEKQLTFLFQETDPYFEMGYKILEQAHLTQMLPYKRTTQSGREKVIFQVNRYMPLVDMLSIMTQNEIIDIIYSMVFMTDKIQENGFMRRESVWYKFDHIFYDDASKKPMFAILPVSQEFRCTDGTTWIDRYIDAITHVASFLPAHKFNKVLNLMNMWKLGKMDNETLLDEINDMGNGKSGMLVDIMKKEPIRKLNLIYSGREGTFQFDIGDEDFIIGKNPEAVNGVLQLSNAVSRTHCKIIKQSNRYFVQDLGSANHTFVNGEYIPAYELMELNQSDVLTLADVDLRVHVVETTDI